MTDIMQATEALRTERMRLINEAKGVYDDAVEAKRGVTAEEQAKVDRIDERIAEIDSTVRAMDERERRTADSATAREAFERQVGTPAANASQRSEAEQFRAWAQGRERREDPDGKNGWVVDVRAAAREAELIRQGVAGEELRSLLWDTGSVGSAVPTTLSRTLYQSMTAGIAAFRMPTTKINTASGETMQFPKVNAHGIATQVIAQGTAIGGTDPTFLKMTLDAFKYGQLVQIANEVIQDSGIDIVSFIGGNIGRAIAQVVDADLVAGTGTGEPLGMMAVGWTGAAGTVATGGSLITPTYENLVDLVYSVNDAYRSSGAAAFLTRDATAGVLRKLRDGAGGTTGAVLWEPSFTNGIQTGEPDRLLGFPIFTDPNVASLASNARIMVFADWNSYYVRQVGGVVIERSDDFAFSTDLATFRGKTRIDGDAIDVTAGNLLKQSV